MATVYEHIKPLQKRAIHFFGQCIWALGRSGQVRSVIDELTLQQQFFDDFLIEFCDVLDRIEKSYLVEQKKEVSAGLRHAKRELAILQGILKKLNPCDKCKGYGELRCIVDQDHSEYSKCPSCGGDGIHKESEL